MMSFTFGLFTQVSGSGPLGPLVDGVIAHADLNFAIILSPQLLLYFLDSVEIF